MDETGNDNPRLPSDRPERFATLMEQVRLGSSEAAEELWRQYGPYVIHVVRRSLHHRLRSRFDSQDFAQAAWASFFSDLPDASQLDSPAALVSFLKRVARNKVITEHRRQRGAKRDIKRQRRLKRATTNRHYADPKCPTPSQQASADEMVDQVTADKPERYRRVLQMRLDGMQPDEIAEREQTTARTVRRVLAHVKRLLAKQRSNENE